MGRAAQGDEVGERSPATRLEAHSGLAARAAKSGRVELIGRRCGTALMADMAAAFDRTPEWNGCDHMTTLAVMES
jgi:hypothetical protein